MKAIRGERAGTMGAVRFLFRSWERLWFTLVKAAAVIYSNPDVAVLLVTMFAGILVATGMDFISRVFSDDEVRKPGTAQLVGLFFLLAGTMFSWVAWSAQQFRTVLTSGQEQFVNWKRRGPATLAWLLAITCLVVAITLLFTFAALKEPSIPAHQNTAGGRSLTEIQVQ